MECPPELISAESMQSSGPLLYEELRMSSPPTCPDSTSDMQFSDVFYSSFSEVSSVLLPDIDSILPCSMNDSATSSENTAGTEDPWGFKSLASDAFSALTAGNDYEVHVDQFSGLMAPGPSSDFSGSFLVTCSEGNCSCDGLERRNMLMQPTNPAYPRTIALDCDVIGVTRVVSDKGCQSLMSSDVVELAEVDSSTGKSKERSGKECTICRRNFSRLDRHVKAVHGGKETLCDCKEKKKTKGTSARVCRFCGESFPKYSLLRSHIRGNHAAAAASLGHASFPPCKFCGRKFSSEQKLRDHTLTHSGKYRYQCDLCDKGFAVVTDLQRHRRTHTGDRPYTCEVCSKQFTQSGSLNRHKRNVHKVFVPKSEVLKAGG